MNNALTEIVELLVLWGVEPHSPTPPFRPKPLTYIQPFHIFIYLGNEIVPELSRASNSARYHYHLSFYAKEDKKNLPKSRKLISPLGQTTLDIHVLDLHNQNRRKVMHFEQENDLKAHFGPIFWPGLALFRASKIFSALWPLSGPRYSYSQSKYAKSPKTNVFWTMYTKFSYVFRHLAVAVWLRFASLNSKRCMSMGTGKGWFGGKN